MVVLTGQKPCKCKENGGCACGSQKSAKKPNTNRAAVMYKNEAGTSFSLSYIASKVGGHFGHMFGAFTIAEEDGKLVIHTGMVRDARTEELVRNACNQPCAGACEDGCRNKLSTREVAGL